MAGNIRTGVFSAYHVNRINICAFSIYAFCHMCKNIPCELGLKGESPIDVIIYDCNHSVVETVFAAIKYQTMKQWFTILVPYCLFTSVLFHYFKSKA